MSNHILIVDDDTAFCEMLTEVLTMEGMTVSVAHDGASAMTEADRCKPNLILLDYLMPGMNGTQVLAKMRETEWGAQIPIVLLTNMSEPEAMAQDNVKGVVTECLLKVDWTLDRLAAHVKELLAHSAQG